MDIIEINAANNGSHRNQTIDNVANIQIPDGWAIIPDTIIKPSTFPFVDIEVENGIVIEMTEQELSLSILNDNREQMRKLAQIQELKNKLLKTDYKAIKFAESLITDENYAETKAQRQSWRDEINQLEQEIAQKNESNSDEDNNDEGKN